MPARRRSGQWGAQVNRDSVVADDPGYACRLSGADGPDRRVDGTAGVRPCRVAESVAGGRAVHGTKCTFTTSNAEVVAGRAAARHSSVFCRMAASPSGRPCGHGTIPCRCRRSHGRPVCSVRCYVDRRTKCRHFARCRKCRHFVRRCDATTGPAALPGPPGTGTSATVVSCGVTTVGSNTQFDAGSHDTGGVIECEVRKSSRPFHDAAPAVTVCVPPHGWRRVDTQRRTHGRCRFVITGARMARCRQRVKLHVNRFPDVPAMARRIWEPTISMVDGMAFTVDRPAHGRCATVRCRWESAGVQTAKGERE